MGCFVRASPSVYKRTSFLGLCSAIRIFVPAPWPDRPKNGSAQARIEELPNKTVFGRFCQNPPPPPRGRFRGPAARARVWYGSDWRRAGRRGPPRTGRAGKHVRDRVDVFATRWRQGTCRKRSNAGRCILQDGRSPGSRGRAGRGHRSCARSRPGRKGRTQRRKILPAFLRATLPRTVSAGAAP